MRNLDQALLKQFLHYDPETGIFTWLQSYNSRTVVGAVAGFLTPQGYWKIQLLGQPYVASRLAFLYMMGRWPICYMDHADGDKLNDVWSNLREASYGESTHNRILPVGESRLRGVRRSGSNPHRWEARIAVGYHRRTLGTYATVEEANAAYLAASETLHGDYAPHTTRKGA